MIDAHELRIGNWLKRKSQPDGFIVDAETISRLSHSGARDEEPIPLTPEWLERMGFTDWSERIGEKDELGNDVEKDWIRYALNPVIKNNDGIEWHDTDLDVDLNEDGTWHVDYHCVTIKYVHQLQNLYFALSGQEIEIK